MDALEVIFELGAEGGSLTVFGRKAGEQWIFLLKSVDQSEALIDANVAALNQLASYPSLHEVFGAMDRYPWHRLYPLRVHPLFRDQIHKEVQSRYASVLS
ncbi:hypothetical protein GCM10027343_43070 [Noviherbaspirillum agri]